MPGQLLRLHWLCLILAVGPAGLIALVATSLRQLFAVISNSPLIPNLAGFIELLGLPIVMMSIIGIFTLLITVWGRPRWREGELISTLGTQILVLIPPACMVLLLALNQLTGSVSTQ